MSTDVEVYSDNTISETMETAFDRELMGIAEGDNSFFDSPEFSEIDSVIDDLAAIGVHDVLVEQISTPSEFGLRVTTEHVPLEIMESDEYRALMEANGTAPATLERDGDVFRLKISGADLSKEPGFEDIAPRQLELLFDVNVTWTFPGPVIETSAGTVDGNSVTFTAKDVFAGKDIIVVASAAPKASIPTWIWAVLGLLVLAVGAALLVLLDQRGKARAVADAPAPTANAAVASAPESGLEESNPFLRAVPIATTAPKPKAAKKPATTKNAPPKK